MGNTNNKIYPSKFIFEPFIEINEKLKDNEYLVTYRYPDDKINIKKMKYEEIVQLAKKLKVEINELPDVINI